jgi:hypothetical protein
MHDAPEPDALLAAVARFLREQALPLLPGDAAFHARVAANVLDIVRRQMAAAAMHEADEARGLRELLGRDGSVDELNRALCARIAAGEFDLHTPSLAAHLWQVTLAKLAVDQPGYASYRRARQAAGFTED